MIWYNNKYLSGFYSMSGTRQTTWWDSFTRNYVGVSYWFDILFEQLIKAYTNWDEYLREGTVNGATASGVTLDTCMGDVLLQLGSVWTMGLPQLAAMPIITHNFVSPTELDITWGVQLLGPTDSLDSELYALWSYRINSNLELVDFQWHHSEALNDFLEWQNLMESSEIVATWADFIQAIWDELGSDIFATCLEDTAFHITIDETTYYGADCTWESWIGFAEFNSLGLIKAEDNTIRSADGTKVLQKDSINVLATDSLVADAAYVLVDIVN